MIAKEDRPALRRWSFVIARTGVREVFDLDGALRRGERYIRASVNGLFIESDVNVDGRVFDVTATG